MLMQIVFWRVFLSISRAFSLTLSLFVMGIVIMKSWEAEQTNLHNKAKRRNHQALLCWGGDEADKTREAKGKRTKNHHKTRTVDEHEKRNKQTTVKKRIEQKWF